MNYADMLTQLDNNEEVDRADMEIDSTKYPMVVNVINPYKNKYSSCCRICKSKNCENCALPVTRQILLRDFLEGLAHKTKFNGNDNLFKNIEHL